MRLEMQMRWLALRTKDLAEASIYARHIPRGFTTSTERWHRRLPESVRRSAPLVVIDEARSDKLVPPVVKGASDTFFHRDDAYGCPRLFVVGVPDGRVYGATGEVVESSGLILADLSLMHPDLVQPWVYDLHKPFRLDEPPSDIESLGRACTVVSQYASRNYFHWMLNLLPRFELLTRAGVEWSDLDSIVVNELGAAFQRATLDRIGIPTEKLVEAGPGYCGSADMLYATRSLRAAGHRCQRALDFVRGLFEDCLSDSGGRRIYVSRSDASKRRVTNEDHVAPVLEARNIEIVSLAGRSVCEQARLFSEADVIVAPHGAGLTNLTFCRPDAKVIEIHSTAFLKKYYWELASARRLAYYALAVKREPMTASDPGDFSIPTDQLNELLDVAGV